MRSVIGWTLSGWLWAVKMDRKRNGLIASHRDSLMAGSRDGEDELLSFLANQLSSRMGRQSEAL
ncbi:hypothetical protein ASB62_09825 [Chlorobium limicola]|uniref:Uncharacterized protein n=1 Tax=Chlorobium limicola TaxID=1092 RepID=A0A101J4V9_CHLLI|nr:hypothetical protein ASB62_09825 [Chlorobium limicola]